MRVNKPLTMIMLIILSVFILVGCTSSAQEEESRLTETFTVSSQEASRTQEPALEPTVVSTIENTPQHTATPTAVEYQVTEIDLCENEAENDYCVYALGRSGDQQLLTIKYQSSVQSEITLLVNDDIYYCQTLDQYPGNLYCFGPLQPNTLDAVIEVISTADNQILAMGIMDLPTTADSYPRQSGSSSYP